MKVHTITLGFVPARIWEKSIDAYQSLRNPDISYDHYFVDCHYPVGGLENRRKLWSICCDRGVHVLDPGRNLGLHDGFNWALAKVPRGTNDIIIGYDPDSKPISPGWDGALVHTLEADSRLAWVSLFNERVQPELIERGYTKRQLGHIEAWITHKPVINSICAWRSSFLDNAGGLEEENKFYGGLEAKMFWKMKNLGLEWAFLPQWWEEDSLRNMQDEEYKKYKWAHAHLKSWPADFESFLQAGCPINDPAPHKLP